MIENETYRPAYFFWSEGFLKHTPGTKELGDVEKVLITGCAGDGNNSGV